MTSRNGVGLVPALALTALAGAGGSGMVGDRGGPRPGAHAPEESGTRTEAHDGGQEVWTPIGPFGEFDRRGPRVVAGRATDFAVDPRNPSCIYLASSDGGVWKTTDGGQAWTPLTDALPYWKVGSLALDPRNPDSIYAGTDKAVLRSDDGGMTWVALAEAELGRQSDRVKRLIVDPAGTVFMAGPAGVFRSVDRGATWELTLGGSGAAPATDLEIDPRDPNRLFAILGGGSLNARGLWRSTDNGRTWGGPLDIDLPAGRVGPAAIAIAPSDPQTIYLQIGNQMRGADCQGIDLCLAPDMYRRTSTDGGDTWADLDDCAPIPVYDSSGMLVGTRVSGCKQAGHNNAGAVDPSDPDHVILVGTKEFESTDGGATFVTHEGVDRGHADFTRVGFSRDGGHYLTNDGGFFKVGADGGVTNFNTGLITIDFYAGLGLHPTNPTLMIGGSQDNGCAVNIGSDDLVWRHEQGGDGARGAFIPGEHDEYGVSGTALCSMFNAAITRSTDGYRGFSSVTSRELNADRGNGRSATIAPLGVDPNNYRVVLTATKRVWQTTDILASTVRWTPISEDLGNAPLLSLAFAPTDIDTTSDPPATRTSYAGSRNGHVWRGKSNGHAWTWTEVSNGLITGGAAVNKIVVNELDGGEVYACVEGRGHGHVYRLHSAAQGEAWSDISSSLPDSPCTALDLDPDAETLYYGTNNGDGVYRSTDRGATWEHFNDGLPPVEVVDLVHNRQTGVRVAVTHGRSAYQLVPAVPNGRGSEFRRSK